MQLSDIPPFIVKPFAESGGRNAIPVTSSTPGAASLTAGFPPETMQPISAGGIPPDGLDMNGILYEVSGWSRWAGAGLAVPHDSAFSTAIGGYPRGALLTADTGFGQWYSLVENNVTDPDSSGTGWMNILPLVTLVTATGSITVRQQGVIGIDATAGNVTVTLPAANAAGGLPITFIFVRLDAGSNTVTISRAGTDTIEGAASFTLPVSARVTVTSDGASAWGIVSRIVPAGMQVFASSGTFTVPSYVNRVRVTVTGGGGAGAGGGLNAAGGGGQAGATAIGWYSIAPGTAVSVTIGAGGVGIVGSGPSGGTSSFGAYASAPGGAGANASSGAGGNGGAAATGGQINLLGGDGCDGTSSSATGLMGGAGGASYWGGGGRMGAFSGGGGLAGRAPGSGGGGAYQTTSGSGSGPGGNGAAGIVVVEW